MTTTRVRAAGDTHPGLQRDQNEDRFFFDDKAGLYCVVDGVGGHAAGERAAGIAADLLRASLAGGWPDETRLRAAFARANEAIYAAASRDATLKGMACVATLAAIANGRVRFAHIGDTRLYKIHRGAIAKLTHDQSPVGELEDAGALTEAEAMRHPRRNEIYRDLGSQPPGDEIAAGVEIGEASFEPDAALLVCSDGLSDQVSAGSVRRIVESFAGSPALAVQELLAAANDAGGKDNVTVVLVEGEKFAASVKARPAPAAPVRPGGTSGAGGPLPASSATRGAGSPASGRGWRAALWLVIGAILGALGVIGAVWSGVDLRQWTSGGPAPLTEVAGPRTWVVGLEPAADFPTIGEALDRAVAGDTVSVGPGEYRETVVLKDGVWLIGSRSSVLRPPVGAGPGWVAISAYQVRSGRVQGFLVSAAADQPMAVGLLAEQATLEVDDLEITGASLAAVELRAGARVTMRRCHLHDNPGVGAIVRGQAEPRLERNVIMHNGRGAIPARPGVLVEPGARPVLVSNGIGGNGGMAVQGWPATGLAELARQNVLHPLPAMRRGQVLESAPPPRGF
jgi:PPM family protein phosphatase